MNRYCMILMACSGLANTAAAIPASTESVPFQDGSWTVVLIPDTQKYVDFK